MLFVLIYSETRKDFIQIFKRLFESFVAEIEETRNDLHCTQIAELMHVVCVERTEALQMVSLNQNGYKLDDWNPKNLTKPLCFQHFKSQ